MDDLFNILNDGKAHVKVEMDAAYRFLKVYPHISAMPSRNETSMPEDVLEEWKHIIRKVDGIKPPTAQERKINSIELSFSSSAKHRLISWKNAVNSRIYSEAENETEKALCGKLETYLIRFCLIIQVMRGICGEAEMDEIDEETIRIHRQKVLARRRT